MALINFFYFSQLNSNGCITQEVKSNVLQIKNMGYKMQLKVEAKIREEGTGLHSKLIQGGETIKIGLFSITK